MSLSASHFEPEHHEDQYRELTNLTNKGMYVRIKDKELADTNADKFFSSM